MTKEQERRVPRVVVDSAIPFLEGVLDPWAEVELLPGAAITREKLLDADALMIRTRTKCNRALLEGTPVRMIATATIGYDHIDLKYCQEAGIEVATAAGCNARGVLQWVAGVLLHLSQKQGWQPHERTLGVVGVGHVGSLVKAYAEHWGFRVLCCDPPRALREGFPSLTVEELAQQCDILTFHTPLDDSTHHLCGEALLRSMRPEVVVLNSSRGAVVDNAALLADGRCCALDVWEGEPNLNRDLLMRAEVATTHIAGYSLQGKANATAMALGALARHFGWPLDQGWYPPQAAPQCPRMVDWQEMQTTLPRYFDPVAESERLKQNPEAFESIRDHYAYRTEYF